MTTKTLPKWATRLIAVILLATDYTVHHAGLIPLGYTWHGINVLGALNDVILAGGMVGLSGPALWPQLAAFLGNPGAPSAPAAKLDQPLPKP